MRHLGLWMVFLTLMMINIGCAHSKRHQRITPTPTDHFIVLAGAGDVTGMKKLLAAGVSINGKNQNGTTAAMLAAKNTQLPVLNFLKEQGADLEQSDEDGDNVMTFAMLSPDALSTIALLDLGVSPNLKVLHDFTPLLLAVHRHRIDIAMVLLQRGADLNASDLDGNTALHLAVEKDLVPLAEKLLLLGADTSLKNHQGQTAFDLAKTLDRTRLLKIFSQK